MTYIIPKKFPKHDKNTKGRHNKKKQQQQQQQQHCGDGAGRRKESVELAACLLAGYRVDFPGKSRPFDRQFIGPDSIKLSAC